MIIIAIQHLWILLPLSLWHTWWSSVLGPFVLYAFSSSTSPLGGHPHCPANPAHMKATLSVGLKFALPSSPSYLLSAMCSDHQALITESIIEREEVKRELFHAILTDPSSWLICPCQFLLVLQASRQILLFLGRLLWTPKTGLPSSVGQELFNHKQ